MDVGLMDLEKEQRLGYLHNYDSAYVPKFQDGSNVEQHLDKEAYLEYEAGSGGGGLVAGVGAGAAVGVPPRPSDFLELDYDRLNATGYDEHEDYYRQPEHYMMPTEHAMPQQSSMFNPQFLPNFNDMMRLVARYDAPEQSACNYYPNESDEYQEIIAESERVVPYRQHAPAFANRSSLELSRVERDNFALPTPTIQQKSQTSTRQQGSTAKSKFNARNDVNNFLS